MTSATSAKLYQRLMKRAKGEPDDTFAEALRLLAEMLILVDIDRAAQDQLEIVLYKLERFCD